MNFLKKSSQKYLSKELFKKSSQKKIKKKQKTKKNNTTRKLNFFSCKKIRKVRFFSSSGRKCPLRISQAYNGDFWEQREEVWQ